MSRLKKLLSLIFLTFVIALAGFFIFRNSLLNKILTKKFKSYERSKNLEISFGKAHFTGLKTVELNRLIVLPLNSDTFLTIDTVSVSLRFWPLLKGNLRPEEFILSNADFNFIKKDSLSNYSFLFSNNDNETAKDTLKGVNYSSRLNSIVELFFESIPSNLSMKESNIFFKRDSLTTNIYLPEAYLSDNIFKSKIFTEENKNKAEWNISGTVNADEKLIEYKLIPRAGNKQQLPILPEKYKLKASFDSVTCKINFSGNEENAMMEGNSTTYGMNINHWRISSENVIIPKAGLDYKVVVKEKEFEVDSTSKLAISGLPAYIYFKFEKADEKELTFKTIINNIPADTLFSALPGGLFNDLQGLKAKGELSYSLHFYYPFKQPDSLKFSSSLIKKDFEIIKYGNTNFSAVNNEFAHTVYEKGKPVRTIIVGPSSPKFKKLEEINDYLKYSVLTSEDGSFFYHKGFNEEAFRKAIAENIKEKRFARGGSTISMQLVKNLFLTRNKTISRKIEEALIVWLIENNRLISKDRMFEIYLNIIEWGPGVYGIAEASEFYFAKNPYELTLEESLFLAMIVPRPKYFKYNFDEQGNLKPYTAQYFNLVASHLIKKGIITEEQKAIINYNVELNGPARNFLNLPALRDSVPPDLFDLDL